MRDVTLLLQRVREGDPDARAPLFELVYTELRSLASAQMAHQRSDHTLQATALVHEAWLKLAGSESLADASDRRHFLRLAARAMRQLLVDHARGRARDKRGGGRGPVRGTDLDAFAEAASTAAGNDLAALDEALEALQSEDPALAEVVELRFFGGRSMDEVADVVGVSLSTAERRFRMARAWLARRLG